MTLTNNNVIFYVEEQRFVVCAINDDGTRARLYRGANPLQALYEMSQNARKKMRSVLLPGDFDFIKTFGHSYLKESTSDTGFYDKILQHAVSSQVFLPDNFCTSTVYCILFL